MPVVAGRPETSSVATGAVAADWSRDALTCVSTHAPFALYCTLMVDGHEAVPSRYVCTRIERGRCGVAQSKASQLFLGKTPPESQSSQPLPFTLRSTTVRARSARLDAVTVAPGAMFVTP